jgi:hypothetical protein
MTDLNLGPLSDKTNVITTTLMHLSHYVLVNRDVGTLPIFFIKRRNSKKFPNLSYADRNATSDNRWYS